MSLLTRIESSSVRTLTRLACGLALVGLACLSYSVIFPRPLPVIFAMSGGHVIGIAAFACYLVAVLLDFARREGKLPPHFSSPTAAPPPREGHRSGISNPNTRT